MSVISQILELGRTMQRFKDGVAGDGAFDLQNDVDRRIRLLCKEADFEGLQSEGRLLHVGGSIGEIYGCRIIVDPDLEDDEMYIVGNYSEERKIDEARS